MRALERDGELPKGLGIKEYLEDEYDEEFNHSRLYQNLDSLIDRGLVEKGRKDDRTNEYATTDAGRGQVEHHAHQVGFAVKGGDA